MKHKEKFLIICIIACAILTSCATKQIPYSFIEGDEASCVLYLQDGNPSLTFVSLDHTKVPKPDNGSMWSPVTVPSGVPLNVTLHAKYEDEYSNPENIFDAVVQTGIILARNVDKDFDFTIPPLKSGHVYELRFEKDPLFTTNTFIVFDKNEYKEVMNKEFE